MSALLRQVEQPFGSACWQPEILQVLEDQHLVAWSGLPRLRLHFAVSLGRFLESQRDTEVCVLYGKFITDLESFCHQLERALPGPPLDRQIDGRRGVTNLLRQRQEYAGHPAPRFRFYVWHDADVLLRHNHRLFGRLVETIAGVAAEAEYVSDDMLLIQRGVFVGGPTLDLYAEDERGQFRAWYDDGSGEPFWRVVTSLERPAFRRYRIDVLGGGRPA